MRSPAVPLLGIVLVVVVLALEDHSVWKSLLAIAVISAVPLIISGLRRRRSDRAPLTQSFGARRRRR